MAQPANPDQTKQLRAPFAWPIGIVTSLVGFVFVATGFTANHGKPALGSIGFGLFVMAGAFLLGIRPGIALRPDGVSVRNPLRTLYLPWEQLGELKAVDVLVFTSKGGQATRAYAISGSLRTLTRVQKAETAVRERWETALKDGTSAGLPSYRITAQVWVALALMILGVVLTAIGLAGV